MALLAGRLEFTSAPLSQDVGALGLCTSTQDSPVSYFVGRVTATNRLASLYHSQSFKINGSKTVAVVTGRREEALIRSVVI